MNGEIKGIISNTFSLTSTYGDEGKLSNGETVTIIGYKYEGGVYHYALYSDHAAGVFSTSSRRGVFSNDLNTKNLPSIEDPDVKNILVQKKEELLKQIIANKAEYKKKALAGEIKGIISYPYLTSDNGSEVPFNRASIDFLFFDSRFIAILLDKMWFYDRILYKKSQMSLCTLF